MPTRRSWAACHGDYEFSQTHKGISCKRQAFDHYHELSKSGILFSPLSAEEVRLLKGPIEALYLATCHLSLLEVNLAGLDVLKSIREINSQLFYELSGYCILIRPMLVDKLFQIMRELPRRASSFSVSPQIRITRT